ncbi:hypothetical protein ACHAQJ_004006 [Trichoderma viride]
MNRLNLFGRRPRSSSLADQGPPAQRRKKAKNSHSTEAVDEPEADRGLDTLPDVKDEGEQSTAQVEEIEFQKEQEDNDDEQEDSDDEPLEDSRQRSIASTRPLTIHSSVKVSDSKGEELETGIYSQDALEDDDAYPPFRPHHCGPNGMRPVALRPINQDATNSPQHLERDAWKDGAAVPINARSPWFETPAEFQRKVSISKSDVATLVEAFDKPNRARLPHCTMLAAATSQLPTGPVMAAVVGLPNVPQFTTWLHRDAARFLYPLLWTLRHNPDKETKSLEQAAKLATTLVAVNAHYPTLKSLLDSNPGVIIKLEPELSLADPYHLTPLPLKHWSLLASIIACAYRLMTSYPDRFPENNMGIDSPNAIWGHSHNNWQAALMCVQFFKNIRGKAMMNFSKKLRENAARWQGLTTDSDAVEATENSKMDTDFLAGFDMAFENDPRFKGLASSSTADFEDAQYNDIVAALGLNPDIKHASATLAEAVHKRLVTDLESFAPSSNPAKLRNPDPPTSASLTDANIDELIVYLRRRANVQYDQYIDKEDAQLSSDQGYARDARLSAIAEEEELAAIVAEREKSAMSRDSGDVSIEELRKTRRQMGTFPPPEASLVEVCASFGIDDWRNPIVPGTGQGAKVPKPHQLTGAKFLIDKMAGPLKGAILMDECGLGKTITMFLALVGMARKIATEEASGSRRLVTEEKRYKPSVLFCPSSVLDQTYEEATSFFGPTWKVFVCYGNEREGRMTLSNGEELQKWFNEQAEFSNNSQTLRTLLIMPYTTATRRTAINRNEFTLTDEQLRQLARASNGIEEAVREAQMAREQNPLETKRKLLRELMPLNRVLKEMEESDGYLAESTHLTVANVDVNWAICDERHLTKEATTATHQLIRKMKKSATLIITATPPLNQLQDTQGWPFKYNKADLTKPDNWYDPEMLGKVRETGEFKGITLSRMLSGGPDMEDSNASGYMSGEDLQDRQAFAKAVEELTEPIVLLNPDLFTAYGKTHKWGPNVAQKAARPVLTLLGIRRGMQTLTKLPDDSMVAPGADIPPIHVRTVELAHLSPEEATKVHNIINKYWEELYTSVPGIQGQHIGGGRTQKQPAVMENTSVQRILSLTSTDPNFYQLTQNNLRNLKLITDMDGHHGLARQGMAKGQSIGNPGKGKGKAPNDDDDDDEVIEEDEEDNTLPAIHVGPKSTRSIRRNAAHNAKTKSTPTAGTAEMNAVMQNDRTGGLQWYFYLTRSGGATACPTTRLAMVKHITHKSPKIAYAIMRVLELRKESKRVLMYCNNPLTIMILSATLTHIGLNVRQIRSSHTQIDRDEVQREFRDPNSSVDCIVTSMALSAFGVNYHTNCSHGLILEMPRNSSTVSQAIGRLWRLGSPATVHWDIVITKGTFDSAQESRLLHKHANMIAAEGRINDQIKGQQRLLVAYEILREHFGQEVNRYPRARASWKQCDDPLILKEGLFYSALAKFIVSNPEFSDQCTKERIKMVLQSWVPGAKLTVDGIMNPNLTVDNSFVT